MKKQLVLITGVSQGIGKALAELFLAQSYQVMGTSRSGNIEISHPAFEANALDLTQMESIKAFEAQIASKGTKFDILINNVGIGPDLGTSYPEEKVLTKPLM